MNTPIASDLSYAVLQERARRGELASPQFDNTTGRLYRLGSYRQFVADPDMDQGDRPNPNPPMKAEGEPIILGVRVRK